ncbi:hypothetical protein [Phenylobacterium sp. NIBR 498073]|uniref:hypothetical protein n=1 Tax=Phenylobacterium sp. NIBR 498073 TaxID=3015177 RepID=UPI0022B36D7F|nr:hypothetical protein [Phenylobacterium sp. NIBR 498073]WGU41930.1 hypothetical protein O4N75_09400 [Phenylobacterium sp. NIBR 498073]
MLPIRVSFPSPPGDAVVATITKGQVVPAAGVQAIVALAAIDQVLADAHDAVVAGVALQRAAGVTPVDRVRSRAPGVGVREMVEPAAAQIQAIVADPALARRRSGRLGVVPSLS